MFLIKDLQHIIIFILFSLLFPLFKLYSTKKENHISLKN